MTHVCKDCGKSAPEVKFSKEAGRKNPRPRCGPCEHKIRFAKKHPAKVAPHYAEPAPRELTTWEKLCENSRPNWGWNHRHVPTNHNKGQEFQI